MEMVEFILWLQKEEDELERLLDNYKMDDDEYLLKQGRLEEVRRILRKLR